MGKVRRWQIDAPTILPSRLPEHYFSTTEPCFYWKLCHQYAVCDKQGKAVCRACADALPGQEYILKTRFYRPPTGAEIIWHTIGMKQEY